MANIRQQKIETAIRNELSSFLLHARTEICEGAMVSVTVVRITADLSLARCYLSIFNHEDPAKVLTAIQMQTNKVRFTLGSRLKNMRKIPSFAFYIDDTLDYAARIDELLKQ
ncbi:MAG: 30S ribosome-binding factor RbfA [Flavobacteriales bacterium]